LKGWDTMLALFKSIFLIRTNKSVLRNKMGWLLCLIPYSLSVQTKAFCATKWDELLPIGTPPVVSLTRNLISNTHWPHHLSPNCHTKPVEVPVTNHLQTDASHALTAQGRCCFFVQSPAWHPQLLLPISYHFAALPAAARTAAALPLSPLLPLCLHPGHCQLPLPRSAAVPPLPPAPLHPAKGFCVFHLLISLSSANCIAYPINPIACAR